MEKTQREVPAPSSARPGQQASHGGLWPSWGSQVASHNRGTTHVAAAGPRGQAWEEVPTGLIHQPHPRHPRLRAAPWLLAC